MILGAIISCETRSVRDRGVYMARIPSIITNQGEEMRKLTEERRKAWILAISREDLKKILFCKQLTVINFI